MSLKEFARKRFLIVDELDAFRFATKKTLMELELKMIDTATNAQSVVAGFQNVNYDVILCNYELGKGKKNGQELLEELRHHKLLKFNSLFFIVTGEVEKNKVMGKSRLITRKQTKTMADHIAWPFDYATGKQAEKKEGASFFYPENVIKTMGGVFGNPEGFKPVAATVPVIPGIIA